MLMPNHGISIGLFRRGNLETIKSKMLGYKQEIDWAKHEMLIDAVEA